MSHYTLAPFIRKRPWLMRLFSPLANWYANAAGYRQLGLRADDLIPEENPQTLAALKRLSPKETYDRSFRIRRAIQCSIQHKLLPKDEWTKPEDDVPYLMPLVNQIAAEEKEKELMDTIAPQKSH